MPWLIKTNLVFLFLFSAVFFLPLDTSVIGRIIRSTAELSFIFFLPGINLAFLVGQVVGSKFSAVYGFDTEADRRKAAGLLRKLPGSR